MHYFISFEIIRGDLCQVIQVTVWQIKRQSVNQSQSWIIFLGWNKIVNNEKELTSLAISNETSAASKVEIFNCLNLTHISWYYHENEEIVELLLRKEYFNSQEVTFASEQWFM